MKFICYKVVLNSKYYRGARGQNFACKHG